MVVISEKCQENTRFDDPEPTNSIFLTMIFLSSTFVWFVYFVVLIQKKAQKHSDIRLQLGMEGLLHR